MSLLDQALALIRAVAREHPGRQLYLHCSRRTRDDMCIEADARIYMKPSKEGRSVYEVHGAIISVCEIEGMRVSAEIENSKTAATRQNTVDSGGGQG